MEILLLGGMGRDDALADSLGEHRLHVLSTWQNPGLREHVDASGGQFYPIADIRDVQTVADAVEQLRPDMFLTHSDDALAAGVVDAIKLRIEKKHLPEVIMPCPDRDSARIEWDKFYLRELVAEIDPSFNPKLFTCQSIQEVDEAVCRLKFGGTDMVVKPRHLTGGKGVRVQGRHFVSHLNGRDYAVSVIKDERQKGVEIQERIEGPEFTLQLFTDGQTMIEPPATYDYPYRHEGDVGPGTGGMGSFSMALEEQLPFISDADYESAIDLMAKLLDKMKQRGHDFKGVLYPTFFKTADGLKLVEVNARGGDPELINILDLLDDGVDLVDVFRQIDDGELRPTSLDFKNMASAVVYLVSPDYAQPGAGNDQCGYNIDPRAVMRAGCKLRFAGSEHVGNKAYRTVGAVRAVALSALGETPWEARAQIDEAISHGFVPRVLDFRRDIATKEYIDSLSGQIAPRSN